MERFELHILGCGSALPTLRHHPTSQIVLRGDKLFMVDCGEGSQLQMRHQRLSFSKLHHIFISHLHGDHCFGLMGLISTFSLLGRTGDLVIHAPGELEDLLRPWLKFYCKGAGFQVIIQAFDTTRSETIYEDKTLTVSTIPLRHRLPCCGFLFRERQSLPHIRRDVTDYYEIPVYAFNSIKEGAGWTTPDGRVIPHEWLVSPAAPPRSYAYCSDTAYLPENVPLLEGVDLLFHEATFSRAESARATETFHSTAEQAATMARDAHVKKLVIGHFSARFDDESGLLAEARAVFPETIVANEGLCVPIG